MSQHQANKHDALINQALAHQKKQELDLAEKIYREVRVSRQPCDVGRSRCHWSAAQGAQRQP